MRKTLFEQLIDSYMSSINIPWRIYGNNSHKLLCKDYLELVGDSKLDDMLVKKITRKSNKNGEYWRIVLID